VTDRKRIGLWFSILCAIPWVVIGAAYVEVCIARLVLSRWPRPMLDDPKELATAPLHCVFLLLVPSMGIALPLLIVWVLRNWRKVQSDRQYRVHIGVFAVGFLAFCLLVHFDPGRVWDWFLD
jgi:hypothetical protein